MQVTVNGEPRELPGALSVGDFLRHLRLAHLEGGVAVCVNGEVIRRADWPRVTLHHDDHIEIVHATQGG
ncbi:MAG: sulfur carrier protein ThiS [Candidatus Lambdaproteobacteria bacterium]|nr:sulfur carrier protein ThiS [Candidatus Lambdaproteobacteria bacterium]